MGEFRQGLRENFRGSFPYYIGFGQETSFEITVDIPIDAVYNIPSLSHITCSFM